MSTDWLEEHLGDESVTVLEISADPAEQAAYRHEHIPDSRFVYWKDLLWHETDREFPAPAVIAGRLADLGVSGEGTVALVGDPLQFGAYAFWVMSMSGLSSDVVLVDGGREKWLAEGRAMTASVPEVTVGDVRAGLADQSSRIGRDEILAGLSDPDRLILDVRSPEEYQGRRVSPPHFEFDYGAERKGRIPGARHLYYLELFGEDGAYLPPDELRDRFEDLPIDGSDVVVYCRLSHRATSVWFAMRFLLGLENVRVYDGSWTEWGTIVGFPIARGQDS